MIHDGDVFARIIFWASLFTLGVVLYLTYLGLRRTLRGDKSSWFAVAARLGYAVLLVVLAEMAYTTGSPESPREWGLLLGLVVSATGFVGLIIELRGESEKGDIP